MDISTATKPAKDESEQTIETLLQQVQSYASSQELDVVRRAYDLAELAHRGQQREGGGPYIKHPLAVAFILADLGLDPAATAAALLHDVPEDTAISLDRIRQDFGDDVARLVDGVTKLSGIEAGPAVQRREEEEAESLRKMFLAMIDYNIRVVFIKLADRLHNMRTLGALPADRQKLIARETLDIFAPLANRLGIWQIKWELEDLALRYLDPAKHKEIAQLLDQQRVDRERYLAGIISTITDKLREEGIKAEISGRPKHIYSIYKKMKRKGIDFERIYDVLAIRLIVPEIKDCYAALGVVHGLWRPIPGEFDDYIAMPKDNMYQSLHTAVVGPEGRTLEVQIRTPEMHKVAEYGVAAHWRYNEQAKRDPQFEAKVAWLRQITEWREDVTDAGEFLASVQSDVFQDRVYVRTPKGKIIDLPAGATPIDFAYRIHTDIGHRCKGAKVDGRLVPLDYQLRSGERVEILTASRGGPSHDWLNPNLGFVKTAQAREKIRQWFKKQKREENIAQGREILDKELMRLDLHRLFQAIIRILDYDKPNRPSDDDFIVQQRRLKEFEQLGFDTPRGEELLHFFQKYEHLDDLYFAIGHGSITPQHIIARLEQPQEATERLEVVLPTPIPVGITVRGTGGFLTSLARCCNPLPGDPIIGYVTRGRGVTIHKRDCRNLARKGITERLIEVDWGATAEHTFPVLVRIAAFDRAGLLRDVSNVVANEGVNLSEARVSTNKQDHTAIITATLEVTSISQLSRLLARIGRLPNVVEARRYTGA